MATQDNIPSLLIPMWEESLLVPNTAVAEVIGYVEPENAVDDQYLGVIYWRGLHVQVLNLEQSLPDKGILDMSARIAIFNTVSGNKKNPFIGVLVNGIPRLSHISEGDLRYSPDEDDLAEGIQAKVILGQETVRMIDMAKLEKMVKKIPA